MEIMNQNNFKGHAKTIEAIVGLVIQIDKEVEQYLNVLLPLALQYANFKADWHLSLIHI